VNADRIISNLALVGFMGTGKSTIGQIAAHELGFEFVDTDALIESRLGVSVSDVFARHGEAVFRNFEREITLELAGRTGLVIATGGGLVTFPGNIESLKNHSLIICLWASAEDIWERVKDHTHRPLLQGADPQAKIRELLAVREPFYRQSDILIHTGLRSIRESAQQVMLQFQAAREAAGASPPQASAVPNASP